MIFQDLKTKKRHLDSDIYQNKVPFFYDMLTPRFSSTVETFNEHPYFAIPLYKDYVKQLKRQRYAV